MSKENGPVHLLVSLVVVIGSILIAQVRQRHGLSGRRPCHPSPHQENGHDVGRIEYIGTRSVAQKV